MNLAKLNHILIPPTKARRDRLRRRWFLRLLAVINWLYGSLSSEGRVLSVLLLLIGATAMEVYGTRVYWLWSAVLGLVLASLLARRAYRLDGVRIEVKAPRRVSVGATVRFEVVLHNQAERDHHALRLAGPFLPWDGRWLCAPPVFRELEAGGSVRGELRARFVERGDHHLDPFAASALVPFGLALGPAVRSSGTRFRVVPRIAPVEHVTLPLGDRHHPGGIAQASRIGEAMELLGVRPYRRGDPVRDLHALTWARTGVPHVREYQQEYFSRIGVIVDNDRLLSSDPGLEASVSLAAGVVAHLSRGEALIDLLVVDGQVHPLTLGRSLGFLNQALDLLAEVQRGGPLEVDSLLHRIEPFLARLSCVVLITEEPTAIHRLGRAGRVQQALAARRELVAALESRGVRCRVLRVARRATATKPSSPAERVVPIEAIAAEEPLWL